MTILRFFSQLAFALLYFLDDWIGLPDKISGSLHYRRSWRNFLPRNLSSSKHKPRLWIHGASVGELEDTMALLSEPSLLASAGYDYSQVIITSSSISARSRLENFNKVVSPLYAGPLPPENSSEVRNFLEILKPDYMLLSHSDLWPLLFSELKNYRIKKILWLPARSDSARFTAPLLLPVDYTLLGLRHAQTNKGGIQDLYPKVFIGNLRVDRILNRIDKQSRKSEHVLEKHGAQPLPGKISFLLGSVWQEDGRFWSEAISCLSVEERKSLQIVALPHELRDGFQMASLQGYLPEARILLLEGILVEAYQNFQAAFIGGAFRSGLHNVLEPALWGLPLYCGPDTKKQPDAKYLIADQQLYSFSSPQLFAEELKKWIHDENFRKNRKATALKSYQNLRAARGASQRLAKVISELA